MESPSLNPIGVVRSDVTEPDDMRPGGVPARVEVFAPFVPALDRLEEHSHAWLLSWFHHADRSRLQVRPSRVDPDAPSYGVFGLRANSRPNPIGLSLMSLQRIERNGTDASAFLHVARLDAVDGTPVVDIKPYFENDTIFSPRTPYLRPRSWEARRDLLYRHGLQHHLEECEGLRIGTRIALIAEARFGHLNEPDLLVTVRAPACVADVLQGITRARLANPPRFAFEPLAMGPAFARFEQRGRTLEVTALAEHVDWLDPSTPDEALFRVLEDA